MLIIFRYRLLFNSHMSVKTAGNGWLHRPALTDIADRFGKDGRFEYSSDRRIAELTIMQVAEHTKAVLEWKHHYSYAIQAEISEAQLAQLKHGEPVLGLETRKPKLVIRWSMRYCVATHCPQCTIRMPSIYWVKL